MKIRYYNSPQTPEPERILKFGYSNKQEMMYDETEMNPKYEIPGSVSISPEDLKRIMILNGWNLYGYEEQEPGLGSWLRLEILEEEDL